MSSNSSDNSALKSESLDQLYKEQLTDLRNLVLKAQPHDTEICRKWLKVFNRASSLEKMARSCLCALMKEQLEEYGGLSEPFTNLNNCNRNLESVLNGLDELSNQSFPCPTNDTFKSHGLEETSKHPLHLDMVLRENQDGLLRTAAADLTSELQSLRMHLTQKEMENAKLKQIAEKYRIESESVEATMHMIRKSILENIKELLLEKQQRGMMEKPLKFFQNIFADFPHKDKEFKDGISKYDEDLQNILLQQYKCDFDKRKYTITRYICRKFAKSKSKLREKYEHRLSTQNELHQLQLKLTKLNSFSILRQIFINFHDKFDRIEGWQVLKTLEDKYQSFVGDM